MRAKPGEPKFRMHQTIYDRLREKKLPLANCKVEEFYINRPEAVISYCSTEAMADTCRAEMVADALWWASGRPYYKVWPGYAMMLSRTTFSSVPTELFHVPYPAFGILLPDGLFRYQTQYGSAQLTSMLVARFPTPDGTPLLAVPINRSLDDSGLPVFDDSGLPVCLESWCLWVHLDKPTLDECIPDASQIVDSPGEIMNVANRLAVAVSMLAVSVHRCVEHDVIAKLRERYDQSTSPDEQERLARKSRQRGVHGFRIGRGRCLHLTTPPRDDSQPTGRQLTYQHVRGGHFHTVCHGPGKTLRKVKFFEPTVVRPDLPPPPGE